MQDLVAKDGPNILRSKGILSFKDDPERFVFQGVHMILDGDHQRPWKDGEKRESRIVFIGRNLPEEKIRQGFEAAWRELLSHFLSLVRSGVPRCAMARAAGARAR